MYGKQGAFLKSDGGWYEEEEEEGRGKVGQLSQYPPHCADLEGTLHQAFVYVFPVHFNTVYTFVFEAAQTHVWRDRCTRAAETKSRFSSNLRG